MAFLTSGELTDEICICLCRGPFEGCRGVVMVEIPPWSSTVTSHGLIIQLTYYSSKIQQWLYSTGVKE